MDTAGGLTLPRPTYQSPTAHRDTNRIEVAAVYAIRFDRRLHRHLKLLGRGDRAGLTATYRATGHQPY
jgi:hypothetical protein